MYIEREKKEKTMQPEGKVGERGRGSEGVFPLNSGSRGGCFPGNCRVSLNYNPGAGRGRTRGGGRVSVPVQFRIQVKAASWKICHYLST